VTRSADSQTAPSGTYWAAPGVLAGPWPSTRFRAELLDEGFRIIDLTTGAHGIEDGQIPPYSLMEDILKAIQDETSAGGRVYVHCLAGQGRTGTVIGCLLAELGEKDPLARLTELRRLAGLRGDSPEETCQDEMVTAWIGRAETGPLTDLDRFVARCLMDAIDAQPPRVTRAGNSSEWPDERSWGREAGRQLDALGIECDVTRDVEAVAVPLGDWDPAPGRVDLHPRQPGGAPGSLLVAELKLDNINESLWDAFKLTWVAESLSTGPQYVAVAAHDRVWNRVNNGTALFPNRVGTREVHRSADLIAGCRQKWCSQWNRDTAKPRRVPSEIAVTAVVVGHRPAHYPALEVRVARIAAVGDVKLDLTGGTPDGVQSCVR
jgi:hypothetical protein